MKMTVRYCT
uniref:Uncharacterized protein n=1 Tax=Anguilla anguilla TaxID=7936 RepID=A0A0E9SZB8_ANGAN